MKVELTEISRIALVIGLFSLIFILSETWRYIAKPPPEWTRKFVHLSCGIVISCFKWIFSSTGSVIALFVIFALLISTARFLKLFPSIYNVKRSSLGDVYYLSAALILFLVSNENPALYFISMLNLTVSDALAAVLGHAYQKKTYTVETHSKSLEGSTVFFLSTFLIVHIPLLLIEKIDPLHSILIAVQIALVVTCLEAVCLNGFDNMMIPIGTYFLLFKLLPVSTEKIIGQIVWQLLLFALTYYISVRFKFLSVSGGLVGQLFLIAAFALGGPNWLILPLISLGIFTFTLFLLNKNKLDAHPKLKIYQVIALFHLTLIPSILIFCHNISKKHIHPHFAEINSNFFYTLFVGAIVSQLVIALYRLCWLHRKNIKFNYIFILAMGGLCYLILIPFSLWEQIYYIRAKDMLTVGVLLFSSSTIFYFLFKKIELFKQFPWEFRLQSISVFCGVMISLPFHLWLQYS